MATLRFTFSECEHQGDLDNYKDDIYKCGGKVVSEDINYDAETGTVVVEVDDKKSFLTKFKETDAYGYTE